MKSYKIARAGGGTGGHTYPIQSLIQYTEATPSFQGKVNKHFRFGTAGSLEEQTAHQLQKEIKNLTFIPILSGKRRREKTISALAKNLWDLCKLGGGILQAIYYLKKYQIDKVFCKGGYVALPVVFAAKLLGKEIYVHESDTRPGIVNTLAAKLAKQNFAGFSQVLPGAKVVGQILSDELLSSSTPLQISPKTNILVMGGSQGAKTIYTTLAQLLKEYPQLQNFEYTVILGQLNKELDQLFLPFSTVSIKTFCSQQELGQLYAAADVVITRAGTTSLAEQELFDLKMLMIPLPWTHDQLQNARRYVEYKDGILIEQEHPDFKQNLLTELLKLQGYKKTPSGKEQLKIIRTSKETILKTMLK